MTKSTKTFFIVLTALLMAAGIFLLEPAAGQGLYSTNSYYPGWSDPWMYYGSGYYSPYYDSSDSWQYYAQAWLNAGSYPYPYSTYYPYYYRPYYSTYYGPNYYYDFMGPRRMAYY